MASRKSQSLVNINAKLTAVELQTIPYTGAVAFLEGAPVKFGADGNAARPTGSNTAVSAEPIYINWVSSARTDVVDTQGDPFQTDLPAMKLRSSGHLTGIRGSGIDVGLGAACWLDGVLPTPGQGVYVSATNSHLFTAKTVAAGEAYYGIVERISGGRAYFWFTTRPIVAVDLDTDT